KITYKYTLNDGNGEQTKETSADVTTKAYATPVVLVESTDVRSTSVISFDLTTYDADNICEIIKIDLFKNGTLVQTAANTTVRKFGNLERETTYTVIVTYGYDLCDGNGEIFKKATVDITTLGMFESSKYDVRTTWSGKTLNVATTRWSSSAGAPWGVVEACVEYGKTSGFGTIIDTAVLDRNEFIEVTYGVTINWMDVSRYGNADELEAAILAGETWDLFMPRANRAQELVLGGNLYDMAGREYINFNQPYYNANSVKTYTAKGHTFFVTGDFSTIDKEIAFVLWFNKDLLGNAQATEELYQKVRDGQWTWNDLIALANGAYSDDGDGVHDDEDRYGLSLSNINNLYYFFGLSTAGVNQSTGNWELTLDNPKINDVISAIITAKTANWCRSAWSGSWGSNAAAAFHDGRLLFYNEVVQHSYNTVQLSSGVVPFPKLNSQQENYYIPCGINLPVLMCIPKNTQDREMSDYFLDVLGWTGSEYLMKGYIDQKAALDLDSDAEVEMLTKYIFPNIAYDAGAAVGWSSLMNDVLSNAHNGNVNNFRQAYADQAPQAQRTIDAWNLAWGSYTDA
ncbi:MAG: hypothetical protein IKC74_02350, partial [Clostridia bacterium]|nr:hypothetical protein [Clostridia bacterium]